MASRPPASTNPQEGTWQHIQRDFSGGEISAKMLMRGDTDMYRKSALRVENMFCTPQGTAKRAPGTYFVRNIDATTARIIPYLTPGNERSLVVMTPETLDIERNVTDLVGADIAEVLDVGGGTITYRKNICPPFFRQALWAMFPGWYLAGSTGTEKGVRIVDNALRMSPLLYKRPAVEYETVTATSEMEVDVATDRVTLEYKANYAGVPPLAAGGGYTFTVELASDADFSNILFTRSYSKAEYPDVGATWIEQENVDLPTAGWTGTLYLRYTAVAEATADYEYAIPNFIVFYSRVFSNGETTITDTSGLTTPYIEADLPDVHFVQSPYADKELVMTHPRHQTRKLFFDTGPGEFTLDAITFSNAPAAWSLNNYPATCTSFLGRLVLAGGQTFEVDAGDPVAAVAETVWATEVGLWDTFTASPTDPDDSVEFTAIYRSPIQWVYGQRSLLVGALEYEYSARGEGILAPGDLAVYLQSTHGSVNVQPAAFGEGVLFPSDGGRKVRALRYRSETDGWLSDDLTLLNPEITANGIVRMVRLRHPHQICVVLTKDGYLALFNSESGTNGWTRYSIDAASIEDIAVVPDREGIDILFMVVKRPNGLALECVADLADPQKWVYTTGTVAYDESPRTATLTGLSHLEGQLVQVWTGEDYVGYFRVQNGRINVVDGNGDERPVRRAFVGGTHTSELTILPPEKMDPGAKHKYVDFSVRTLGSTRPIIGDVRLPDRDPEVSLNRSQPVDTMRDNTVIVRGWDAMRAMPIREQLPMALEVLGVFGKVKQGTVR